MNALSNIVDRLEERAWHWREKPALVFESEKVSYCELLDRAGNFSDFLIRSGVAETERVGVLLHSGIEYVVATLGILRAGAVAVPIPCNWPAPSIDRIVREMELDWIAGDSTRSDPGSFRPVARSVFELPQTSLFAVSKGKGDEDSAGLPAPYETVDPAFIRFSSGTTSSSKGVLLSHPTIAERIDAVNEGLLVDDRDVVFAVLDMNFHFVSSILLFLLRGATVVLCGDDLPGSLLRAVANHEGTLLYAAPIHYEMLSSATSLADNALDSLRLAVCTAAASSVKVRDAFDRRFDVPIAQAYGIIEAGIPCIDSGRVRCGGSVGKPLPAYEVRIDSPGEEGIGEVLVAGPGLLDAYVRPWQLRDEIVCDGWFRTGDLGRFDADGFLHLHGRVRSAINMAGMKIFPEEVEEILNRHAAVAESLVHGEAHPALGAVPVASIVLSEGSSRPAERELRRHCYRHLPSHMAPKSFEFVAELPRTASGKLLRR